MHRHPSTTTPLPTSTDETMVRTNHAGTVHGGSTSGSTRRDWTSGEESSATSHAGVMLAAAASCSNLALRLCAAAGLSSHISHARTSDPLASLGSWMLTFATSPTRSPASMATPSSP